MSASPYRVPHERLADAAPDTEPNPDGELAPIFGILWVSAIVRVALAATGGETFGAESTLALLVIPAVPLLMSDWIAARLRRRRVRREDG